MKPAQPGSWRVVLLTDMALIVNFYKAFLPTHGHRLIGRLTCVKRNSFYLDVIGAALAGVDVLLSDHRRRWVAMLAPLKLDLIISHVFSWRIPAEVLALPKLGIVSLHGVFCPSSAAPKPFSGCCARVPARRD